MNVPIVGHEDAVTYATALEFLRHFRTCQPSGYSSAVVVLSHDSGHGARVERYARLVHADVDCPGRQSRHQESIPAPGGHDLEKFVAEIAKMVYQVPGPFSGPNFGSIDTICSGNFGINSKSGP